MPGGAPFPHALNALESRRKKVRSDGYPFRFTFRILAQKPLDKRIKGSCVSLADHFLNFRLESGKPQREIAEDFGCDLVSYQQWEKGAAEPQASGNGTRLSGVVVDFRPGKLVRFS